MDKTMSSSRRPVAKPIAIALTALMTLLLVPGQAGAFKIETHVWIGQQVLNDLLEDEDGDGLSDGTVTIEPFEDFPVRTKLVEALRLHQAEYRMGNIGPDGFPDLVSGQMTTHPGVPGTEGWPTDRWLKHVLSRARTPRQNAFAYGYLTHAAADIFAHTYVNAYSGDIFDLEDGVENELRHTALEDYMKRRTPPIRNRAGAILHPASIVDVPAGFVADALVLDDTVAEQYKAQDKTRYLAEMHDFWSGQGDALNELDELLESMNQQIQSLQDEVEEKEADIDSIIQELNDLPFLPDYPLVCILDPTFTAATLCATLESTRKALADTRSSLHALKEINTLTVDSVRLPLRAWRDEVNEAIRQYILTGRGVVVEIMAENGDPAGEISRWLCEWGPAFMAIPNETTRPGCETSDAVGDFMDGVSDARSTIAEDLGTLGWLLDPITRIRDEIVDPELERLGAELTEELTGRDSVMSSLVRMRTKTIDADALNAEFSHDASGKGLLELEDVAARVDADMALTDEGQFDPEAFRAVHNAVVLAKLVLLEPSQLNRLANRAGLSDNTVYGPRLYPADSTDQNILFEAVRSIDGHQQWQEFALPSPRVPDREDQKGLNERNYGYSRPEGGFRFWQDCEAREKVFRKIFHGPLAPGLVAPGKYGLPQVLAADDPNRAAAETAFPVAQGSHLELKVIGGRMERYARSVDELVIGLEPQTCGEARTPRLSYSWAFAPVLPIEFNYTVSSRICDPHDPRTNLVVPSDARLRLSYTAAHVDSGAEVASGTYTVDMNGPANTPIGDWSEVDDFYLESAGSSACGVLPEACRLVDNGDGTVTDTCTDLMWLEDANRELSSKPSLPDAKRDIESAQEWVENLEVAGYDDWRLPRSPYSDPSCDDGEGEGFNCRNSELGHLYYVALGNRANGNRRAVGPFENLDATGSDPVSGEPIPHDTYWMLPAFDGSGLIESADVFNFRNGHQSFVTGIKASSWPVRDILPADLDGNGVVNDTDYQMFLATYGLCSGEAGFDGEADYDKDGCVSLVDYQTWYDYFTE